MRSHSTPNTITMRDIVEIFSTLGDRLANFGHDDNTRSIIAKAVEENPWFTEQDILWAVDAIRTKMLTREALTTWLSRYPTTSPQGRRVAVIMAGNIPLVGFFDLLCVIAAGDHCYIKPSSKDRVLMIYIVDQLRDIEPSIAIFDYSPMEHYDMAIATGGDDANRYFREHFATTRTLLRGSRHSIAVLNSMEKSDDLVGLFHDITAYSGLGCRSVSLLFVPRGYTPELPYRKAINKKLARNVAAERALLTVQGCKFIDCGAFLLIEGDDFSESLARVTIKEYENIEEVKLWIEQHHEHIQCIVSNMEIKGSVPFGQAQYPRLDDYADGVDTMCFLLGQ